MTEVTQHACMAGGIGQIQEKKKKEWPMAVVPTVHVQNKVVTLTGIDAISVEDKKDLEDNTGSLMIDL